MSDKETDKFFEFLKSQAELRGSEVGIRISRHIINCDYCKVLTGSLGYLIEMHMKEKENVEKLV